MSFFGRNRDLGMFFRDRHLDSQIMLQFIIPNQPFMINNLKQDLIGFGWFWSLLMLCSLQSQNIEVV